MTARTKSQISLSSQPPLFSGSHAAKSRKSRLFRDSVPPAMAFGKTMGRKEALTGARHPSRQVIPRARIARRRGEEHVDEGAEWMIGRKGGLRAWRCLLC